jgi:hypothetical protein
MTCDVGDLGDSSWGCGGISTVLLKANDFSQIDPWVTPRFPLGHPDFSTGSPNVLLGSPSAFLGLPMMAITLRQGPRKSRF